MQRLQPCSSLALACGFVALVGPEVLTSTLGPIGVGLALWGRLRGESRWLLALAVTISGLSLGVMLQELASPAVEPPEPVFP